MDLSKLDDVANSDIGPLQNVDQRAPLNVGPTETEMSVDFSIWKVKLKAAYKRVTGRVS